MNNELIEKYKKEMLNMYRNHLMTSGKASEAVPAVKQGFYTEGEPYTPNDASDPDGRLTAIVTAISELYPVKGATVTVLMGDMPTPEVIDSSVTDESGKSKVFSLPAPPKALSLNAENTEAPYALYHMLVEAEGYADNLHINIPVFGGVSSLQSSKLTPISAANSTDEPIIFDESNNYPL